MRKRPEALKGSFGPVAELELLEGTIQTLPTKAAETIVLKKSFDQVKIVLYYHCLVMLPLKNCKSDRSLHFDAS